MDTAAIASPKRDSLVNRDELNRLDLNLLVAFNALSDELSVSRAAERLHVTQPAMSKTLQRLRDMFDDQLFLRTPKGLEPTPRSSELRKPVAEALDQLIKLMTPVEFDPSTLARTFMIAAPDPCTVLFVPDLVAELGRVAPNVKIKLVQYDGDSVHELARGKVDMVCGVIQENTPAGIYAKTVFRDKLACVTRANHPLTQIDTPDFEQIKQYPTVSAWFRGISDSSEVQLNALGLSEDTRLESSHFGTIFQTLQRTDTVMISIQWLWKVLFGDELATIPLPEPMGSGFYSVHMLWDERSHNEPASQWFRQLVIDSFVTPELS